MLPLVIYCGVLLATIASIIVTFWCNFHTLVDDQGVNKENSDLMSIMALTAIGGILGSFAIGIIQDHHGHLASCLFIIMT